MGGAAMEAAILAARAEAMKAVREVATRAARKAARDALMAMVAKSKLAVVKTWKPSALISVINARSDLVVANIPLDPLVLRLTEDHGLPLALGAHLKVLDVLLPRDHLHLPRLHTGCPM